MRCVRIGDVGGVVIERRQRADRAGHHRHRMGVAAEALEEPAHLLVDHRVARHAIVEVGLLRRRRQFPVEQQVAGLEEVAVLGELLDRHAAIEQDAFVAVDVGDLGFAGAGRGEAGVEGEHAGLGVELADVDHVRADRAAVDRERRNPCPRPKASPVFMLVPDFRVHVGILDPAGPGRTVTSSQFRAGGVRANARKLGIPFSCALQGAGPARPCLQTGACLIA